MKNLLNSIAAYAAAMLLVSLAAMPGEANAGRQVKNNTRTSVNNNVNVRRDVDIDVDVDRDYHPVATAAAVVTTAIVVGSVVNSLPPACTQVLVGNVVYQQCGGYWYQPQYVGSSVTYVVVNPPR
jgi:hypothetical protein